MTLAPRFLKIFWVGLQVTRFLPPLEIANGRGIEAQHATLPG